MPGIDRCSGCSRSNGSAELALCNKSKEMVCKDCCVKSSGGLAKCQGWKVCWLTTYV